MAKINGSGADDVLWGTTNDDKISGKGGDDYLFGDWGDDTLIGGSGDDTLVGGDGHDVLRPGQGSDTVYGGYGDDWIVYGGGAAQFFGGEGFDVLDAADWTGDGAWSVGNDLELLLFGSGDQSVTMKDYATTLDITVFAGAGADLVYLGAGDDYIDGGKGSDTLWGGGSGYDTLVGGSGDDLMYTGDGAGFFNGGSGDDTLVLHGIYGSTTFSGGAGYDILDATADWQDTVWYAGGDVEGVFLGSGDEWLYAVAGNVKTDFTWFGGMGDDTLDAAAGKDYLYGGSGRDDLSGGASADTLEGGEGGDILTGGKGKDVFLYWTLEDSGPFGADWIADLRNEDVINLSLIDANANKNGNQKFKLVDAFTDKAGQALLTYDIASETTILILDVDGDSIGDAYIYIDGKHTGFDNFIL